MTQLLSHSDHKKQKRDSRPHHVAIFYTVIVSCLDFKKKKEKERDIIGYVVVMLVFSHRVSLLPQWKTSLSFFFSGFRLIIADQKFLKFRFME